MGAVNHAAIFPACRAVVHQGGAGTTAAGMRAGIPTLILWHPINDQQIWADAVTRLKVGSGRAFSPVTWIHWSQTCVRSSIRNASLEPARSPPR